MPMSKMGKVLRDVLEKTFERLPFDPQDGSIYNEGPMMMMMRGHVEFFCASYLVMPYSHTLAHRLKISLIQIEEVSINS